MDVLNEYKSYVGNFIDDDKVNEIVMGSLIFKSQLEDMFNEHFKLNEEASIMLSIPDDLDYIYTEESTLDTLVPFTYYGKLFYFSKFIIIKLFFGIADISLDYIQYSELNEETNLYEMNVVPVIKILANKNNFCKFQRR
mgnify:FL=1|jgi:hypothetical protein